MTKPIVFYRKLVRCKIGESAVCIPLNHYSALVSNTKEIVTSTVLQYDPDTGDFETLNTLYRRKQRPPTARQKVRQVMEDMMSSALREKENSPAAPAKEEVPA